MLIMLLFDVLGVSSYWCYTSDLDIVRLQSSGHRRFVRPKMRQKPSQGHLRLLMERNDVTSDISPDVNSKRASKLDPNTYSTYMGEHYLETISIVQFTIYCVV